jgi:hypothetical protein
LADRLRLGDSLADLLDHPVEIPAGEVAGDDELALDVLPADLVRAGSE